jgi:hypothetical protein
MQDIQRALAEPFDASDVQWKPQSISGSRALAVAYIDARAVMDRLDEVLGAHGWQDDYAPLDDGCVVCRLSLYVNDDWLTKQDVGAPSDQKDSGDRRKSAFSDALKRAAVKWGIGRYLYALPAVWCDWDAKAKAFVKVPVLPPWALPARNGPTDPRKLPTNGKELLTRLNRFEQGLVSAGRCKAGELLRHISEASAKAGLAADMSQWDAAAMQLAVDEAKRFGETHKAVLVPKDNIAPRGPGHNHRGRGACSPHRRPGRAFSMAVAGRQNTMAAVRRITEPITAAERARITCRAHSLAVEAA